MSGSWSSCFQVTHKTEVEREMIHFIEPIMLFYFLAGYFVCCVSFHLKLSMKAFLLLAFTETRARKDSRKILLWSKWGSEILLHRPKALEFYKKAHFKLGTYPDRSTKKGLSPCQKGGKDATIRKLVSNWNKTQQEEQTDVFQGQTIMDFSPLLRKKASY